MESATMAYSIALAIALAFTMFEMTATIDLTPRVYNKTDLQSCTTTLGAEGVCVDWSYCSNTYEILPGGNIFWSEIRSSSECTRKNWCCSNGNLTKPPPPKPPKPPVSRQELTSCTTGNMTAGKCVDKAYCDEILPGGNITDNELRSPQCESNERCCSNTTLTDSVSPTRKEGPNLPDSSSNCIVSDQPNCSWCVKLYRDGKDRRHLPSGFFCMGTLIGTRVILTTATCMTQAQFQNLWAKIPSSPEPNTKYTVKYRLSHPKYNSGTRENDLALLTIDPEPNWDKTGVKGACIGLTPNSITNQCTAAGIDETENIKMTPLLVTSGNCGRGASSDAACGNSISGDCSVVMGSPLMCRSNGTFMMAGLAKMSCSSGKVLISHLVQAEQWLHMNLKGTMGLLEKDYTK